MANARDPGMVRGRMHILQVEHDKEYAEELWYYLGR